MNIFRKLMVAILSARISIITFRIRHRDYRAKKFNLRTDMLVNRFYRLKMLRKKFKRNNKDD